MQSTKPTRKQFFLVFLFLAFGSFFTAQAQEIPFSPRLDDGGNSYINIKGDYTFLSNTVMNRRTNSRGPNDPYNGSNSNNNFHIEYIDIDGDASTFSSSSSTLSMPDCSQIYYAALYWAGNYDRDVVNSRYTGDLPNDNNRYDFTQIKFRVPGGTYIDIQADNAADPAGEEDEIIIDGFGTVANSPYVCYRDVTTLLQGLANPEGEYFVGNVRGTRGRTSYGVGGWTLVVIYENPTLSGKYISTFDGYEGVTTQNTADRIADIDVNGFNTIPVGPVEARIGVSVLEGERNLTGDQFQIETPANPGFTNLSNATNPSTNFFNASITIDGANVTSRNINGANSMGYDSDIFDISNPANSIIENGESQATLRLTTDSDWFASFLVTFGVDIIEPDILLEKKVEDIAGNDITGMGVNLGQTLEYVLSFINRGNDDGTNYTIRDVLPLNVTLDESNLTLPAGVTYVYTPATREVIFTIPDNLIEEGDPFSSIRMRVQVAENCFDFVDACTDLIENVAFSTYEGVINDNQISDDPSVSDFDDCGFVTPGATNFLLDDLSACNFTRTVQLCGDDVILDAGDNFDSYVWVLDTNGNNLIDPSDTVINDGDPDGDPSTILVDDVGTYIVDKIVADPCKGFQEIIIVERFGATQTSPIIDLFNTLNNDTDPFNDIQGEIVSCSIDGDLLPKIFLCGINDSQPLQVNITDADSIEWEQLDEGSCGTAGDDCANKDSSCTWNTVATGTDFNVNSPGKYRLVINYANGCSSRFFFNVFQNLLDIQYNASDIICTTPGNITITNLGSGYGYRLIDDAAGTIEVPFSANNGPSFTITTNGAYRVEVTQLDAVTGDPIPGACIFSTDEIGIRDRDFQVDVVTKDSDCTGLGEISISILNVEAQYYYEISQGGTTIDTHGPVNDNNYTFENLNPGIYDVLATTDDGCSYTEQVTIVDNSDLSLDARVSQHITCREGNIQMDSNGGRTPHVYAIWSFVDEGGVTQISYPSITDIPGSEFQTSVIFDVLIPGDYTFAVVDRNNCFSISNTVTIRLEPSVAYDPTTVINEQCFGDSSGSISFNITDTNGYQLTFFLIDDATGLEIASNTSGTFSGLPQGNYTVRLNQRKGSSSCDFFENYTISGPTNALSADALLIQDYSCLVEGIIEAQNVSGGTAPYEYSIDGINFVSGAGAERFSNLTNGTYTITVRDDAGCTIVTPGITIDPLNEPSDLTFAATSPTCPALTADVTLTVVDGNTPFTYEIIAPASAVLNNGNNPVFTGLVPNTYTFRVTDDKGCAYDESFTIAAVAPINVVGQLVANISCVGTADGELLYTVSGFNTSYDYAITGPASFNGTAETNTTIPLNGLADGTYTITVTDTDTSCTATADVIIGAPAAALTLTVAETQPSCTTAGSVLLTGDDGWGGYSYTITYPDAVTTDTNTTGSFTALPQDGTYTVTVTDANNCTITDTFTLNAAVAPVLEIIANDICYDDATGLVLTANVLSGGDGNFEYSLNGGVFGTSNVFTGLGPGTYTIDVRDGNACADSETITINPALSLTATADNITACGTATDVTITAAGGDGNFVFAIVADGVTPTAGDFGTTNPISVTGIGDYDVYVRDNSGNTSFCEASFDINIAQDTPLVITPTATPVVCFGEANGAISLAVTGGNAPYEYSIDNGTTYQVLADFVNLSAGTYNVRVRDANACDETLAVIVTQPDALVAEAALTQNYTCLQLGEITVGSVTPTTGGSGDFQYSINGGAWTTATTGGAVFSDLTDGTYTIQVRDANAISCVTALPDIVIAPLPTEPVLSTTIGYACDGLGIITVLPNDPSFTYSLDAGASQTSNVFNNVTVGTHTITVDYGSGCTVDTTIVIDAGNAFTAAITSFIDITCNAADDGEITFEVENFDTVNGFEYAVNGGAFSAPQTTSPVNITGLSAGTVNIEVRDVLDNSCTITLTQIINEPTAVSASVSITSPDTCLTDATISVSATGGTPSYEYQLEDTVGGILTAYQTTTSFSNLVANDYIVRVRDANLCETTAPITITAPEPIVFTATETACYSGNGDADIVVNVTNVPNNGGFQFSLNGGAWIIPAPTTSTTHTFSNLSAGTYTIDVRDQFGCVGTQQTITINPALSLTATADNITACGTATDVTITAAGGDGNFVFAIVADGVTPTAGDFGTTNPISVTGIGDYDVYVRDNSGNTSFCEASFDINIAQDAPLVITPTATPVVCFGEANGAISLAVTGGNAPYEYSIDDGTTYQVLADFVNLSAGTYNVRVRDANACDETLAVIVTQPDALVAEAALTQNYTCVQLGEITVGSVTPTTGGSGNFQYSINGGAWTTATTGGTVFTDLTDGTYTIQVRDANAISCVSTLPDVVIAPLPTEPVLSTTIGYACDGLGIITVLPNDPTFTYSLDAGASQTSNVFNNVSVGTHTITVDYGSGCTIDTTVVIDAGNAFTAGITSFTDVTCNAASDGEITFEIENFDTVNGFEYAVNGGAFSAPQTTSPVNLTGLSAGTVNIEVRDVLDNSCTITLTQIINEPASVDASANITTDFTCTNTGATITASATGGTPAYEYQLEDTVGGVITAYQTGVTFINVAAGDYIVRVRDTNGCEDPIDTAITVVAPNNPTFAATPTACYSGGNDASILVDVTSLPGNGGFQFSLNGGPFITPTPVTATSHTFQNLTDGTYTIDVRDGFGCSAAQQTVTITPQLTASAVLNTDLTCLVPAAATITANGGSGTFSFEWSNDAGATYFTTNFTGNAFSTSTAGTYIFRVTDTTTPTACVVVTAPITITPADLPVITSVTPTNILCNGDSTGALDVLIDTSVGRPPYTIEVIETVSSTNYGTQTTGLPAGSYSVTITDDKGCVSAAVTATISQPDLIVYDIDLQPITCDTSTGTNPGSITVENLTGGVAEYTYYLTGNNGYSDSYITTAGGEDHTFNILEFGIYEVDVIDANGCSVRTTNIIASPPDDLDIDVSATTVDCTTGGTAEVTVATAILGTNYEFAILETFAVPYSSTYFPPDVVGGPTHTFTGLVPGITYTFVVHDITTNCYYFETAAAPINSPSNLTNSLDVVNNITCTGSANGNVSFTFDNYDAGATAVNYEIFNAQSNVTTGFSGSATVNPPTGAISVTDFATLPQGVYYILYSEVGGTFNGCSVSSPDFTITESTNLLSVTAASPENDNCNPNEGVITAQAQFGTAPYEFQYLLSTDPAPTAASAGWTSNATANVESGDYIVYVKDANNCIQNDAITVALDPSPEISLTVVDECVAEGAFEVLVTLDQAGITPYLLSVNGGAFQNITFTAGQYTVTGLSSGAAQTIEIRDLNGCGESENFTIQPPLQFNAQLTTLLDCEVAPANNAEITIEVTTGSGTYDYEIDGPGAVDQARTALPSSTFIWNLASAPGDYIVTVYDTSTTIPNCLGTITVNVPTTVVPVFTETHIDVTCNGGADGTITLNETDTGISPLSYAISPVAGTFNAATFTFEDLPAGTYTVTGTGTNDCTFDIANIVIDEPNVITVPVPTVVEFNCATGNNTDNATISINAGSVSGGSGTYTVFEFINDQGTATTADDVIVQSGAATVYTETNTLGGTYIINVYDDNGCVGSNTATIIPFIEISNPTATITQAVSCNPGNDAEVQIGITQNPVAPVANITYSVTGTDNAYSVLNQVSDTFTAIGVGNYLVTVSNTDTGCEVQTTFEILDPNNFEITTTTMDVLCFGDDGSVSFTINDPVNPYTGGFSWQLYDSQGTIADLTDDVIIAGATGTSATVGPTTPFNIGEGSYRVDITQDSDPSCIAMDFFNIAGPPAGITADTNVTPITCVGADGSIEIIDVLGGWGNYMYYISTTANPDPNDASNYNANPRAENLVAGTYDIWVIDQNGCSFEVPDVTLSNPTPITAALQINTPNCSGLEGEIEVVGTAGGQGSNYTYQLQVFDGATFVNTGSIQTTTVFANLGAGQYQVVITDQWTCTVTTNPVTLFEEIEPQTTIVKLIDCTLNPGGEITITQTGGSGNFDYEVTFPDGLTTANNTTGVFTNLIQDGTYTFTVTDQAVGHACAKTFTQNLDTPILPVLNIDAFTNVSCNAADDGTITISAIDNGTSPYTFEITAIDAVPLGTAIAPTANDVLSATFTALSGTAAGTIYTITATAANGCTSTIDQTIVQPDAIANVNATVVEFLCAAGNNTDSATITVDDAAITGGSGVYVIFEFINDQGTASTADDVIVQTGGNPVYTETNLAGGTYIINAYDNQGCLGTTTAAIAPFDTLQSATVAIVDPISCSNAGEDIEINAVGLLSDSTANPANYEFRLLPSGTFQASNAFNDLAAGTHVFEVRNVNTGCLITVSHLISDPNTFDIVVDKISDVVCFGTETGEVTLELTDATYVGGFNWTIYDTNGTPAVTTDDVVYKNGTSATNGPTSVITLIAGSYIVEITQAAFPECTNTQAFTIAGPSAAITAATDVTPISCIGNDGIIEIIDVLGGWGGYSYFVGTAAPADATVYVSNPRFDALVPGTYEAWVIDSAGCQQMVQNGIVLADPIAITATLQINQENCTNLQGEIEVIGTAGGQGSNYTYQLIRDGVAFGAPQNTTVFSGLGAGSYEVQINDQWSCTTTIGPEVLFEEINLTSTVIKPIDCTVTPGGEITINVAGGSANLNFVVTYPDGFTTANNTTGVFTGLTQAGTYSFEVTDLDTTNPVCSKTITEVLVDPTPITFDTHTVTDVSCNGLTDGTITVNLSPTAAGVNDNPVYTYNIYDGGVLLAGPQNSPLFTGLAPGSYEVEAVSGNGCSLQEVVIVGEPTALVIDATATAFVCNPSNTVNTATITVTVLDGATTPGVSSGTSPYLYSIDNVNFQTGNTFNIVDTGVQQTIDVFVQDANGCPQTAQVIIDPVNTFTATVAQNTAITCAGPEQVTITVADNGDAANVYTFELLPLGNPNGALTGTPSNVTAEFDLTAVGNYTFRVTDTATGCYVDTAPYEIVPFDLIEVTAVAVDPVICFGDTNGSLEITVTGYTGNYDFEVFDSAGVTTGVTGAANTSANPFLISGLSGGNYSVTVVESDPTSTLCDADSNTITIISPDMALTATVNPVANVTCTNDQGEISVTPTGGYTPYDIVLTNTTTGQLYTQNDVTAFVFTGLSEGNFTVVITDDNGCAINDTETLIAPTPITADISPDVTLDCFGDATATIQALDVLNGQGPGNYQYQLNYYDDAGTTIVFTTGPQSSDTFNNIGSGIYSITVSDGWSCDVETAQVTVSEPTEVSSALVQTQELTCAIDATLLLTASGGTGPYQYSTDNITFTPMSGGNTHTFTVTTGNEGVYQYYVIDSQGCEAGISNQVSIDPVPQLVLTIDASSAVINCNGENTAIINASATGGLGNYMYELFSDAALTTSIAGPQTTGEFNNLSAGTYYVNVESEDCTVAAQEVVINEPTPLVVTDSFTNVSCAGDQDGSITVELSGGAGGYQYAISPNLDQFDTINTFDELTAGTYTVIAQDQNGCFEQLIYTITEPSPLGITATATPEVCFDAEDGTITVAITGGTAPYSTAIDANDTASFVLDRVDFMDLAAGNHVVFVRDAQGCETNVIIEVEAGVNLNATVTPVYECTGDIPSNFVNITLEDDTVLGDVLYALDSMDPADMQLTPDFRNTAPGTHFIAIAHANGCINTIDFVIEDFEPLTLQLEQNNINEITAIATGGLEEYTFYFDGINNGTDNTFIINRTDTYEVRVVDENGCEVIAFIPMEFIDIEIPNFFTPDGDGQNDLWIPRNIEQFPQILIKIYDRYGRVVAELSTNHAGWDGLYKNSALPTGDYWYVIQLNGENDDREFVGHFTLYR